MRRAAALFAAEITARTRGKVLWHLARPELLARVTLTSVVAAGDKRPERVWRRAAQSIWRDPETGYVRRHVSPPGAASGIEIVAVDLPPSACVPYPPWENPYAQQLYMLDGELLLTIGEETIELCEGDCIDFDVERAVTFTNRGSETARYIVFIRKN